ncbi:MAG TPA: hypothetical protein VLG27_05115 [Candidatus Saccharimonadia bacterium]|nr:hypothetical protein [Candidatus Saccharimonadia bacterium]
MKRFSKLIGASIGASAAVAIALIMGGLGGNASAIACFQYDPSGNFQTSQTPVFNNICGITTPLLSSQGNSPLGDEPNFVRIRNHSSDNPVGSANPMLVDNLTSACSAGDEFDVWTYVHNNAEAQFNDNGSGSAVAHNVKLATSAPLNTTNNKFQFSSTVSASNAASASDSTTLNCNGQPVKLTLVANSVHYNNNVNQTTFGNLSDSTVNSTIKLGSPIWGSSDEWGCWDFRIVVVYTIKVQKETPPPPSVAATCDLFTLSATEDRKVTINQFKFTATNANFKNVVVNWGDNKSSTFTNSNGVVGQSHQLPGSPGSFLVSALVTFTDINGKTITSGGPNSVCAEQVSFVPNQPPHITPPPSTPPSTPPSMTTPPTSLVNTGPGSVAGLFAVVSVASTAAYRRILARRLNRQ